MQEYSLKPYKKFATTGNYLEDLNPEQLQAVTAEDGPSMVIAGAGSGKTRIVTYRVAYLVDKGIPARNILLVTFTQKAAREMLHRLSGLISMDTSQLWGGTFHHIGNLILRRHASKIGYSPDYTILDNEDAKDLIHICRQEVIPKEKNKLFPKAEVLQDILTLSLNTRQKRETVIEERYPHLCEFIPEINKILDAYQKKKKEINAVDFDDLLVKLLHMLNENQKIKDYYARYFVHILVDEYQDTNLLQAEIVDSLASYHHNLMVVGDDFQSIYSFRGARFENILEFPQKYPDAKIFTVDINYRSRPEILEFANYIISSSHHRFKKELKAVRKPGIKPVVVSTIDVYQQASFLAQRIFELYEEGIPLKEMAILYRAHFHSMEVQMELTRRGIPFWVRSGLRFFEQAHLKDVLSYMKIIENKKDQLSWMRLLKHIPKVGAVTSSAIYSKISNSPDPLTLNLKELKVPKGAERNFNRLINLLKKLNEDKMRKSPGSMIHKILEEDYSSYLEATYPDWERRLEDIQQLARFAERYPSSQSFLSELSLIGGLKAEDILDGGDEDDGVILSTIHQAKGLEWKVVFIIWLVEGYFPSYKAGTERERDEERRLFYVALTRTKDQLYLTYPIISMKGNSPWTENSPSSFLAEVDPEAYEEWTLK
ncbi:MAG TPA: ATP-dependent helicase [Candidatus Omnitrophica bacterium]|nr:ATP-dependent helicase [Candidatus Omnitrophota bacterium]